MTLRHPFSHPRNKLLGMLNRKIPPLDHGLTTFEDTL